MQWLCQLKPKSQFKSCSNSPGGLNFIWKRYNVWAWLIDCDDDTSSLPSLTSLLSNPICPKLLSELSAWELVNSIPMRIEHTWKWFLLLTVSQKSTDQDFNFCLFCELWEIKCINAIKQPQQYIVRHRSQLEPQDILPWTMQQPVIWKPTVSDI